ncbi:hypothetical protein ANCDUO_16487 [Ancylostoma duodenale]|uniref:Uncharacterized protein n=1 Tax=Ancylostoma duodenale TaxID=51022 RepID=A0A0C2CAS8_9BILA|nr:hypothetical protein ANCDUO_16487 [Ancylostoma duodenale]
MACSQYSNTSIHGYHMEDHRSSQETENRAHLRNTKQKFPPNDHTLSVIRRNEVYQLEKEFYDFAKEEFMAIFKKATNGTLDALEILRLKSQYHYEKIKPERPQLL